VRVVLAYLAIIIIWSTTPLAIKWSLMGEDFLLPIILRTVIGLFLSLLCLAFLMRSVIFSRQAVTLYTIELLGTVGAVSLTYWSAQYISSGLIAVIYGLAPLITGVFSVWLLRQPWLSFSQVFGLLIALVGLIVVFYSQISLGANAWKGIFAIFIAVILYALVTVLIKRLGASLSPIVMNAGGLLFATPVLIGFWFFSGYSLPEQVEPVQLGAVVYLGFFRSFLASVLFLYVLQKMSANSAMLIPVITPALALWVGYYFDDEHVGINLAIGTVIVLSGLLVYHLPVLFANKTIENATV